MLDLHCLCSENEKKKKNLDYNTPVHNMAYWIV